MNERFSTLTRNLDTPPQVLSAPLPSYPPGWAASRIAGPVTVVFTITPTGAVGNPTVLGPPSLDLAALALQAIMQWRFTPAMKAGVAVPVRARQSFEFKVQ